MRMPRPHIRLVDEPLTKQEQQCRHVGADLYPCGDPDEFDEDIVAWGADPCLICEMKEQLGEQ
jgi:hypothetical protein